MRLFGSVTYDWNGRLEHAAAGEDVIIRLEQPWLTVTSLGHGTKLVAWESVRELSGWSPIAEGDR